MTPTTEGSGCFAVVTGGGTAGHVLPAIAVAESLVAAGHDPSTIHYVGSTRGIERRLLPDTPFPHTFVDVVGFQRRLDRRNLGFVPKMTSATRSMIRAFRDDRPRVVVSVGGYASMPSVFAADRLDIPIVVVSYDRTPGRASRLAARRAAACAVAFEGSPLPRAEVTGAPLRRAILDVDRVADRASARRALDLPDDRFVVAVMGGSLGSGPLNEAIGSYLTEHRADAGLAVHQVAGERFAADVEPVAACRRARSLRERSGRDPSDRRLRAEHGCRLRGGGPARGPWGSEHGARGGGHRDPVDPGPVAGCDR